MDDLGEGPAGVDPGDVVRVTRLIDGSRSHIPGVVPLSHLLSADQGPSVVLETLLVYPGIGRLQVAVRLDGEPAAIDDVLSALRCLDAQGANHVVSVADVIGVAGSYRAGLWVTMPPELEELTVTIGPRSPAEHSTLIIGAPAIDRARRDGGVLPRRRGPTAPRPPDSIMEISGTPSIVPDGPTS